MRWRLSKADLGMPERTKKEILADKAKEMAPDQADGMVDQAAQAAKDAISGQ